MQTKAKIPLSENHLVSAEPLETRAAASLASWFNDVIAPTQKLGLLSQSNSTHAKGRKDQ